MNVFVYLSFLFTIMACSLINHSPYDYRIVVIEQKSNGKYVAACVYDYGTSVYKKYSKQFFNQEECLKSSELQQAEIELQNLVASNKIGEWGISYHEQIKALDCYRYDESFTGLRYMTYSDCKNSKEFEEKNKPFLAKLKAEKEKK